MGNLDIMEAAIGGPFTVRLDGQVYTLPSPLDLDHLTVLESLQAGHVPQAPKMLWWQDDLLFARWSAHYDLPDFRSAQRLAYVIDRYRSALVYDLQVFASVDLGELWRARRWRTALDLIDHLPGHSWYSAAISDDEEHAAMIGESLAAREREGEKTPSGPSLNTWTPEVAAITRLTDEVKHLIYTVRAVNGDKKAKPPTPEPRPQTPLEAAIKRASFNARKAKHESLVSRMLPHKRRD